MTFPAKIILLILALPLLLLLFCLFFPILILLIVLGIFSPSLRGSYRSFSTRFPGSGTQEASSRSQGSQGSQKDTEICDVECTVLHAETVDQETTEERKSLQ